jgi:hypothetical protein
MLPSSKRHDEQHGLDAWREQVEEARNRRGENRSLYGVPDKTYSDFLEYMFFHYGENASEAEKATAEG